MEKGEVYELHEKYREKLGAAHGYLWVYEDRHDTGDERRWGTFRSVASGHVMNMPIFAVVAKEESLMRKILRGIRCLSS
jgi:hypothetical protein